MYDDTWPIEWNSSEVIGSGNIKFVYETENIYRYNGTEIPELIWDKEAYPYAMLLDYGDDSRERRYHLYCANVKFTTWDDGIVYIGTTNADAEQYHCFFNIGESAYTDEVSGPLNERFSRCIWSNHDVIGEDGSTVAFAASEPVFVSENPKSWLVKVSNLTLTLTELQTAVLSRTADGAATEYTAFYASGTDGIGFAMYMMGGDIGMVYSVSSISEDIAAMFPEAGVYALIASGPNYGFSLRLSE